MEIGLYIIIVIAAAIALFACILTYFEIVISIVPIGIIALILITIPVKGMSHSDHINYKEYLDKYKFTHLLVKKNDPLYEKLKEDSYNYILIKRFKDYDIYINSDNM